MYLINGGYLPNREQEEQHLAEAERHIAEAGERIHRQQQRIGQSENGKAQEKEGEELLATMLESFSLMKHHRDLILDALAGLNRSPTPSPAI